MVHPKIKSLFSALITKKKAGNSYLFFGTPQSLPLSQAQHLIQGLLCQETNTENPCQACQNCKKTDLLNATDTCTDLIHLTPNKNSIGIQAIRQLQDRVKYGPSEHPYLFVIIHNSECMTQEAANAFLKTLEEPHPQCCFCLLTYQINALLPTIRSRCQDIFCPPLPSSTLANYLTQRHPEIMATAPNPAEQQYLLATDTPCPTELPSFETFSHYSLIQQLDFTTAISKDKPLCKILLTQWIQDLQNQPHDTPQNHSQLTLLIETLQHMTYNVNQALQLSSLVVNLNG